MLFGAAAIGYLPVVYAGGVGSVVALCDALNGYLSEKEAQKEAQKANEDEDLDNISTAASDMSDWRSTGTSDDLSPKSAMLLSTQAPTKKKVTFLEDAEDMETLPVAACA
eukprot:gnl/MRDRNA2_/MRDRNA2_200058_c0_seq1.p1 gnl/MRDRNA2_/MRDRNA2_200058_c0~~gnl/MRDRNA2_/MRDRNA2_200058_c0_seq1.p1  ORF type:complete len:110 (+),score=31.02 gnl/MRDRNA2_/MRDRNA2_200058_c0_seq1:76-405(+)